MNTVARLPGNADSKGLMRSIEFGGFVLRAEHGRSPKPSCPKPQDHKASADLHRGMYFCVHVLVLCISVCVVRNDFISLFGKHARTSDFYLSTFHAQNSLMCVMDDISQDAYLCLASGFHCSQVPVLNPFGDARNHNVSPCQPFQAFVHPDRFFKSYLRLAGMESKRDTESASRQARKPR